MVDPEEGVDPGPEVRSLSESESESLLDLAVEERVALIVADRWVRLAPSSTFAARGKERVAALAEHRERLRSTLDRLDESVGQVRISSLHVKGFATEVTYSDGSRRQLNDIELFVRDIDDAVLLMPGLSQLGFVCEYALLREAASASLAGLLVFRRRETGKRTLKLEILVREQPLSFNASRAIEWSPQISGIGFAGPNEGLRFLAGEMNERRVPKLRDLLDLVYLRKAASFGTTGPDPMPADLAPAMRRLERGLQSARTGCPETGSTARYRQLQAFLRALRASTYPGLGQARREARLVAELLRWPSTVVRSLLLDEEFAVAMRPLAQRIWCGTDPRSIWTSGHYVPFMRLDAHVDTKFRWLTHPQRHDLVALGTPFGTLLPTICPFLDRSKLLEAYSAFVQATKTVNENAG